MDVFDRWSRVCSASEQLFGFQTYVDYMSRLYEREIKEFFEVAKIKMAGTTKEAKGKFGKTCNSCDGFVSCSWWSYSVMLVGFFAF